MKGDKECEDHNCEGLRYCKWHPDTCYGKPWEKKKKFKMSAFEIWQLFDDGLDVDKEWISLKWLKENAVSLGPYGNAMLLCILERKE